MGFVYKITNIVTKKLYIGQTKELDPLTRWKRHQATFTKNVGCPALRDAVKKYGVDNFKFEVLIICFDEDRFNYEKEYIKKYNTLVPNGYNILEGGIGGAGFKGKYHSEETKSKLRKAQENIWTLEKRKENSNKVKEALNVNIISERMKSSDKWKTVVEQMKNRTRITSFDTKEKIRNSVIKYYNIHSGQSINIEKHRESMCKAVGRPILQYSNQGVFIQKYNSIAQAGRDSGIKKSNIHHVLKGTSKFAGGYIWRYEKEA